MISVEYFYDEMKLYEVNDIISNLQFTDFNLWESSRLNSYIVAQSNSKKKLNKTDIIKFPWDIEETDKEIEISSEDIQRLKEKAKSITLNRNGK